MTLHILLTRPIIPVIILIFILAGIGTITPNRASQIPINIYTAHATRIPSPVQVRTTTQITPMVPTNTQTLPKSTTVTTVPAATSSKHYSVPSSLRGDGGERGDGGGYDN